MNDRLLLKPRRRPLPTAVALTLLLAACAVGPDFTKPQPELPDRWSGPAVADQLPPAADAPDVLARWWMHFDDPTLDRLIRKALAANPDIRLAEARLRQARAARGIAAGGLGPALEGSGSYRRSRSGGASGGSGEIIGDQYQAGFDAIWEIDLFGGRRRDLEAADADLQAAIESHRDARVSLIAEVARNYIGLRALQQQLVITRRNLSAQQHSTDLTRQRFEGGFVSALDVANAQAQAATTAAQLPALEAQARQAIHSLSVLLGAPPADLSAELSPEAAIPIAPPAVPAGVPSDLLRRRADIRAAEAGIHAATARIGVAAAELFPKFTLSGALGYQSDDFGSWFDWANRFWSLGPSVRWRLFETGRIRAGVELQRALQEQEVILYQQIVLTALREVEDALIAAAKEQARRQTLSEAVAANRKAVRLAQLLYTEGQTDFLNVLQAQRALYTSEDALVQSTRDVASNLVALYKALGGGWEALERLE